MINFEKIIRSLRKSTLDDIAKKSGINVDNLSKDDLVHQIETYFEKTRTEKKFTQTNIFQIGFPIITLVLGFVIGSVIDISNIELRDTIVQNNVIESSINSDIKNISLLLYSKEELKPDNFIDDGFLVRITDSKIESSLEAFYMIGESKNDKHENTWTFWCESSFFTTHSSITKTGFGFSCYESSLKILSLPISLKRSSKKPFNIVRDLDECEIELFLPCEMSKHIFKIRLVANSGFHLKKYTLLFEKEILDNDWEKTEYKINNNFTYKINMSNKYVKTKGDLQKKWIIDIRKASIDSSEVDLPDISRLDYQLY